MRSRSLIVLWGWIAVAVLAGAAVRLSIGPVVVDDAYITFRYARSLALTGAFEYNPGVRVLGTTTPLFTMMMAGGFRAGWSPEWTAIAISIVSDGLTIVTLAAMLLWSSQRIAAALTALLLAVSPVIVTYCVSGLETSLYTALVYACLLAGWRGNAAGAGLLTGAAALCRPDAVLCALVLIVHFARTPRKLAAFCIALGVVVAPWVLFATWYFGSPIPQSIVAKSALDRGPWIGVRTVVAFFAGSAKYVGLSAAAAIGIAALWSRAPSAGRLVLLWAAAYTLLFTVTNAFSDFPWYFVPLFPIYFAAVGSCCSAAIERVLGRLRGPRWITAPQTGLVLLTMLLLLGAWRLRDHESFLRALAAGREDVYARAASDIAGRAAPTAVVAATEIGTVGYFYPGPILDLVGIVSPEAVGRPPLEVMLAGNAEWLVTYDTHFDRDIAGSSRFTEAYELMSRSSVGPARALEVYRRRGSAPR